MNVMTEAQIQKNAQHTRVNQRESIEKSIAQSFEKIAPFWPLKNLIAVNPLAGFENLAFESALKQANAYFQQQDLPEKMQHVNRESIKWLQAFFDAGQSTIQMPLRHLGLLKSTMSLLYYDQRLHKNDKRKRQWLKKLPRKPETLIAETLLYLGISVEQQVQFLTLMLTTLPGWAAHIQYRTNWADAKDATHPHTVTQSEYLALRLVLTCLIWPEAKQLLAWHQKAIHTVNISESYQQIIKNELVFQKELSVKLAAHDQPTRATRSKAQWVFCIDVRSEPFRRALEAQGDYQTYGFAGFFGIPVAIQNAVTGESHASCPVLLKPAHTIKEEPSCSHQTCYDGYQRTQGIKKVYQSLKYTFTTPFSLVETLGLASGLWMLLKSVSPSAATAIQSRLKKAIVSDHSVNPNLQNISLKQQVAYGAGALKMIGMTENFSPLVFLCGHGSTTQNNAYATALDCGACGGRHGAPNARILANILNASDVRDALKEQNIHIPDDTVFVAAQHNTTTDEVVLYDEQLSDAYADQIASLKQDLQNARIQNSHWRSEQMGVKVDSKKAKKITALRAKDWAQLRPEWGLAKNAAFIVGPRSLTQHVDLEGRAFLHSYEWQKDPNGEALSTILTAPMVVAQWINAQYFFSTLDNVAFGGGSKVTKNITGKMGIMQGNASDLMHGLPLQSVYQSDDEAYHQSIRLHVLVHAPKSQISAVIRQHSILQKLFGNGWVHLICDDPQAKQKFSLQRDLTWTSHH